MYVCMYVYLLLLLSILRYDVVLGINTFGALHVLSFAKKCIKLKVLLHVSTGQCRHDYCPYTLISYFDHPYSSLQS